MSTSGAGRPQLAGLRIWSAGARTVLTPSSVEPYTSQSDVSPKACTYLRLSSNGHGAALAITRANDDVS